MEGYINNNYKYWMVNVIDKPGFHLHLKLKVSEVPVMLLCLAQIQVETCVTGT